MTMPSPDEAPRAEDAAKPAEAPAGEPAATQRAEPAGPDKAAPRRLGSSSVLVFLVGSVALAAGYYGAGLRFERTAGARFAAIESRLGEVAQKTAESSGTVDPAVFAALEARVAALEDRPAATPAINLAALMARLDAAERGVAGLDARLAALADSPEQAMADLEARVATLESSIASGTGAAGLESLALRLDDLGALVDAVNKRIATVERDVGEVTVRIEDTPASAVVVAVGQLRAAARGRVPFPNELAALRAVLADDAEAAPILDRIAPLATAGVATLDDLRASFGDAAVAALAPVTAPDAPWYERALDRLGSLVTVRRVGTDVEGDGLEARIARAEAALADDDLADAVADLADARSAALEPWLAAARDRLVLEAGLDELDARALALVTTRGGD